MKYSFILLSKKKKYYSNLYEKKFSAKESERGLILSFVYFFSLFGLLN